MKRAEKVERVEGVGKGVEVELERRSEGGVKVRPRCPWCGGEAFKDGFRVTREGRKQRYQCKSCGHKFTLTARSSPEPPGHDQETPF